MKIPIKFLAIAAAASLASPAVGATFTFFNTGSLNAPRTDHTATLLPNGKVLVAGGLDVSTNYSASAELYDPASGTWTATGSLNAARYRHTATLLPNGKVLVAGGHNDSGQLIGAELYDPASGTWTATGSLTAQRSDHTATLLSNGKVLVAAGIDGTFDTTASAELYDPASGTWTATGGLNIERINHTATLLSNGKVLVAAGYVGGVIVLASAELYDPVSGTWTETGNLNVARDDHTATLLLNGMVLVAGGFDYNSVINGAELYDPARGTWTATSSLNIARNVHTATLLSNGLVLVAGGLATNSPPLTSAELYNPTSGKWTATGSLNTAHANHAATLLPDGAVLVAGGQNSIFAASASAELFDSRLPVAPPHGGLSPTFFAVNDSFSPSGGVADTVLRFATVQTDTATGLIVRVQAKVGATGTWTDLPNGDNGWMTFEPANTQFVLHSTNYPLQNGVHFRAVSSAPGYSDSISNEVGPFDLATNTPHLGPPLLFFTANGHRADLDFLAAVATVPNGLSLRVQSTTTPKEETSWTNLNHSSQGEMQRSTDPAYPRQFLLLMNNHPAADDLYFRVIASLSGSVDSISAPLGPFTVVPNTPPKVALTPKTAGSPGSGDGKSPDHPIIVSAGTTFLFEVTAQSSRPIRSLKVQIDGSTFGEFSPGTTKGSAEFEFTTKAVGDRVVEAVAVNDLGATARAGTDPVYVRVLPSGSSALNTAGTRQDSSATAQASGKTFIAVTNNGAWTDPNTWRDSSFSQPGVPGPNDFAILGSTSVRFATSASFEVKALSINGGQLIGRSLLVITGQTTIAAASFVGAVTLYIDRGAVCELVNPSNIQFNPDADGFRGIISNNGTLNIHGSAGIVGADRINNFGTLNFQTPLSLPPPTLNPAAALRPMPVKSNAGAVNSDSKIFTRGKTDFVVTLIGDGGGTLIGHDGATLIGDGGGTLIGHDGATLIGHDGATLIGDGGGTLIGHDGATLIGDGGGTILARAGNLIGHDGATFLPQAGVANIRSSAETTASESEPYAQSGGETNLNGITIIGPVAINGGSLTGSGLIAGNLTNNGFILPGNSTGGISILGNYTQGDQGSLIIENAGPNAGQYDQLHVSGVAALGGKLQVRTINGYVPDPADTFSPLGFASASGSLSPGSNTQVTVNGNGLLATVNPNVPGPSTGQPLNIATRLQIQTGENVLIAGFIITGPPGSTKQVLIRGIGPSLAAFGVPGTIPDPLLELNRPASGVVSNDNWQQASNAAQIPNGFAPSNTLESAIYISLAPGPYTAVLKGAHGETGVGLVEVYDFETSSAAKLANIATRGFVNTGDNVMIGGFIVGGTQPANVLVRAIGPSLTAFGVQGALQDTSLELHDQNGTGVISNDDWRSTQEAQIIATTIPPSNDRESAILATLVPGNYTAIVRGANNTIGLALIEAYNL